MTKIALILSGLVHQGCALESALIDCGHRVERAALSGPHDFARWSDLELAVLNQPEHPVEIVSAIETIRGRSQAKILHYARVDQEEQIVASLQAGADHLVPTTVPERVAASVIRALGRPRGNGERAVVKAGPLEVDTLGYQVRAQGERVLLTLTEFKILAILAKNATRAVDREELRKSLSSDGYVMARRMIDYHILGLRKRLGRHGTMVKTVRGVGYRLG
ncbi:MAG TPA: winged helix-turn-helix domain-containing protein [Bdellovibrionota bacterium]|nr:winged helix-turn-helix domain-containing protein [Bdellovibrionota bacterium]